MTLHNPARSRAAGFTLVELMIVVAIVAILASIAYPSYRDSIVKGNRGDAQQVLLQAAQAAERYYVINNNYTGFTLPAGLTKSPEGGEAVYNLAVLKAMGNTFEIRAKPVATKANKKDGYLQINQEGLKTWDKDGNESIGTGESTWAR